MKHNYFSLKIFITTIILQLCFIFAAGTIYAVFTSKAYNLDNKLTTGTWIIPGPSGATGETGPSGTTGETGPSGVTGETGPSGVTGETGPSGVTGETGPSGTTGETGPSGPSGIANYGVSLQSGSAQYIDSGTGTSLNTLTTNATWEFWIKPKNIISDQAIITRWGNTTDNRSFKFSLNNWENSGTYLLFAFLTDAVNPSKSLTSGAWGYSNFQSDNWYHVAWVFDGTATDNSEKLKLYINGQFVQLNINGTPQVIPDSLNILSTESIKIGADGLGEYYDGTIDNVSIWNVSRSESAIKADYLNELNGDETGLVAYWKMNEGSGGTISDSTSNLNNGTFANTPSWVGGYPQVVLNEMMPKPGDDYDWVELYNRSNRNVDISGWQLVDTTGIFKTFTLGTILNNGNFETVTDYQRLTNSGDTIYLKNQSGEIVDSRSYTGGEVQDDKSIGRNPDGAGNWKSCTSSSKNSSNNPSC